MKKEHEIIKLRTGLISTMKTQGLSQLDVCRETGIGQPAVSLFLNGHRSLSGDAALRMMKFLHIHTLQPLPSPQPSHTEPAIAREALLDDHVRECRETLERYNMDRRS